MFSRIRSAVCAGIEGRPVNVETDVARGLPGIYIVGLASTMIMESRVRIRSAIENSGLQYPMGRITVNLTPASLRKNGSGLDLPIAVGILVSNGQAEAEGAAGYGIIGELALDGRVLGVRGVLPMIEGMKKAGFDKVIIPEANVLEASLVSGIGVYTVENLTECIDIINGRKEPEPAAHINIEDFRRKAEDAAGAELRAGSCEDIGTRAGFELRAGSCEDIGTRAGAELMSDTDAELRTGAGDYSDISGQEAAKRAIVIATTGRHGLLMIGSPGCGKTMLSSRIPTIMPPMSEAELIETAMIYSAAGRTDEASFTSLVRPFRHPHHTIGRAGFLGGGLVPVPGEISLAHNGVLFLDEICEFSRENIEGLRVPIEERKITHFRRGENFSFPCSFQLVMASNPCPCGYYGDREHECQCTQAQIEKYRKKLSGPVMDRIDMKISMERVTFEELTYAQNKIRSMGSEEMRRMVREGIEFARASGRTCFNAELSDREVEEFCLLSEEEEKFMKQAYEALGMSPRSYKRTLKVARTIADLDKSESIKTHHLAEALNYRIGD